MSSSMAGDLSLHKADAFIEGYKMRRTVYDLGSSLPVKKEVVICAVKEAIKHVPSSFNNQANRAVVLFGKNHASFWSEAVWSFISGTFPKDKLGYFEGKINSFKEAAGTVLFFVDTKIIEQFQKNSPAYKDAFPVWAEQSSGMVQFAVWSTLAACKTGGNLQHYNDMSIEKCVKQKLSLPAPWKLIAQMPFGNIVTPAGDKSFPFPIDECVLIKE